MGKQEENLAIAIEDLPENWNVIRLEEYCYFQRGTEPGRKNYNTNKGVPFLRVGNLVSGRQELVFTDHKNIRTCTPNDILMTFDGSPGYVSRGWKGAYSSGIRNVIITNDKLDKNYLYFALQTRFTKLVIDKYSTGVTIKHASKAIPHIFLPLPPLPEQRSIAHVLTTVRQAIDATERVIEAARELKRSMMNHLFTYGPVPVDQADQVLLKETEIGEIPGVWDECKLGNLAEIEYGIQAAVANNDDPTIGIPILTNKNITLNGTIDLSSLSYYNLSEGEMNKILNRGDVLLNWRSGSQRHVGKSVLFNLEGDYVCSSFILRIRLYEKIKGEYLANLLNYMWSKGYFIQKRSQSSVNSVFNKSATEQLSIVFPTNEKQVTINSYLSMIDYKIKVEKDKKKALDTLFISLLHHLMTGKLRVPYEQ